MPHVLVVLKEGACDIVNWSGQRVSQAKGCKNNCRLTGSVACLRESCLSRIVQIPAVRLKTRVTRGNRTHRLLRLNCRWFTSVDVLWLMISTKLSERG